MSTRRFEAQWIGIARAALEKNISLINIVIGRSVTPCFAIKANAYGHDALLVAHVIESCAPNSWVGVHSVEEARELRADGIKLPLYIMGPIFKDQIAEALTLDCRFVAYTLETIIAAEKEAALQNTTARIHIKVETGNHRQGVVLEEVLKICKFVKSCKHVTVEGLTTHFANIEDLGGISLKNIFRKNTDATEMSSYPQSQLESFSQVVSAVRAAGFNPEKIHTANSAATLLFPETHFSMVRPGLVLYGMWPSPEVKKEFQLKHPGLELTPALTWKTRIAQIKDIPAGKYIGYGCTYKTKRPTRLAILPVGYSDGYDRRLSNKGYVMIHGQKAPIRGRVCMNITMVDCTDIPKAQLEDEVTLLGAGISAEDIAHFTGQINYEVTTNIRKSIPRFAK